MTINVDMYRCNCCNEILKFDTSVEYEHKCTKCGSKNLRFSINFDMDTDKIGKKAPESQPGQYEKYIENKNKATCPYCQSHDTKKISITSKVVSTGIFGLSSSKVGKQWHCNDCKSDF